MPAFQANGNFIIALTRQHYGVSRKRNRGLIPIRGMLGICNPAPIHDHMTITRRPILTEAESLQITLSSLPSLTIDDLLRHPTIAWHRGHLQAIIVKRQIRTADRLARDGKIHLVGEWPTVKSEPRIRTFVDYDQNKHKLPTTEKKRSRTRITKDTDLALIERFADREWSLSTLLSRPDITLDIAKRVAHARGKDITTEHYANFISRYIDLGRLRDDEFQFPWRRETLSYNSTITLAVKNKFDDFNVAPNVRGTWNMKELHRNLPIDDLIMLCKQMDFPPVKKWLSANPMVTYDLLDTINRRLPDAVRQDEWDMEHVTRHTDIETILRHPEGRWSFGQMYVRLKGEFTRWFRTQDYDAMFTEYQDILTRKLPPVLLYRHGTRKWSLRRLARNSHHITVDDIYRLAHVTELVTVGFVLPHDRKAILRHYNHDIDLLVQG